MLLIPGIIASSGAPQVGDFESIATVTVGSGGVAEVEFTSIPNTYQHLQIRLIARTTRSDTTDGFLIQFNGDTGSNYARHVLYGDGSSAVSAASTSQTSINAVTVSAGTAGSNVFGAGFIDILDYSNGNKNTTIRALTGSDNNGNGIVVLGSGLWNNTAAITSIKILRSSASWNLGEYSTFALYGIKG